MNRMLVLAAAAVGLVAVACGSAATAANTASPSPSGGRGGAQFRNNGASGQLVQVNGQSPHPDRADRRRDRHRLQHHDLHPYVDRGAGRHRPGCLHPRDRTEGLSGRFDSDDRPAFTQGVGHMRGGRAIRTESLSSRGRLAAADPFRSTRDGVCERRGDRSDGHLDHSAHNHLRQPDHHRPDDRVCDHHCRGGRGRPAHR